MTRRAVAACLAFVLLVSVVAGFVINAFVDSLHNLNCSVVGRQVAGLNIALESAKLSRDHDVSPAIRTYYAGIVPKRVASLAVARADLEELGCALPADLPKEKP